jgi:regulator of sirC expression with transglutaminase-like and TPR domain
MADLNKKEVNALINLLDDPDEKIFSSIKGKILDLGEKAIPVLEDAWESSVSILLQTRIENIIHRIQFDKSLDAITEWKQKDSPDLLEGAILIARYHYPELDEAKITESIRQLHRDVWLEMNDQLTALEKVRVINHIFFDVHHFVGNTENYTAPENSYINKVLESKKGNPLSLAIIYLTLCRQLNLSVYGVNLPQHFVMVYIDELIFASENKEENIMFYINPFSKGAIFSRREIDIFLNQLAIEPQESFYMPCSNIEIMKRLIRNLITSYTNMDAHEKISDMKEILKVLNS